MPRKVQPVGLVVLVTLSLLAGAASWAQQKPGSGTNSQGPSPQPSCTPQKMTMCAETAKAACGADAACIRQMTNGCLGNCDHP
jgi:hypothetical protein